ncbi:hypothetical protein HPP92_019999 [Vanilla planifolia]|uniref:Chaperone DnaJ C-terminal domain-containing protein n=1 Tax=Vanilla planifolia TaxID=51239 RepID=A0A835UMB5_VANPL|nr:hypothetical protein HPP92_019999 [Vanilla planifolia]
MASNLNWATDQTSLKIAVAIALYRLKNPRPETSSSSESDAQRWKKKAKLRKLEILRLREELKLHEDGKWREACREITSCRCHFFDECSDSRSIDDHWIDEVLRNRFLRLVRWKERRKKIGDGSTWRRNFAEDHLPRQGREAPVCITSDIAFVLQQKEHPKFKRKGNGLFLEHTLSFTEARCGFREIVKLDQFKAINDDGMPTYQRPFMRGKLYIHFMANFLDSLSLEQCKTMEVVLCPRNRLQLTDMELDKCEGTTLQDMNIEEEMSRKQAQA